MLYTCNVCGGLDGEYLCQFESPGTNKPAYCPIAACNDPHWKITKNIEQTKPINTSIITKRLIPNIDYLNEKIEIDVIDKMNGVVISHCKEVINLREKVCRESLIALGWKPPN